MKNTRENERIELYIQAWRTSYLGNGEINSEIGKNQKTEPYEVVADHNNGTVTIQKSPYVTEKVNKRRLQPFHTK